MVSRPSVSSGSGSAVVTSPGQLLAEQVGDSVSNSQAMLSTKPWVCVDAGFVLDAGVGEHQIAKVQQPVQPRVEPGGRPRRPGARPGRAAGPRRGAGRAAAACSGPVAGNVGSRKQPPAGRADAAVVVGVQGPLVDRHLQRHRQAEPPQVLLTQPHPAAEHGQGLLLGAVAAQRPGWPSRTLASCVNRTARTADRSASSATPDEAGVDLQPPDAVCAGQQREDLRRPRSSVSPAPRARRAGARRRRTRR